MPEESQSQKPQFAASEPATGLLSSRSGTPANATGETASAAWSGDGNPSTPIDSTVLYSGATGSSSIYLGRYRLERMLGRGGMGVVWLAFDPRLARQVAIKMIRPDAKLGPDAVAQFLEEGRRLAALRHADILPIYDCGNENGVSYLVAEYLPRGTLSERMKHETIPFDQAAEIVAHVAEAANYAHVRGLVHRDIKPANILLRDDGKPLLADFGLAIAEEEQLREAPGTQGTYAYMAPEQMLGESRFVDGRADIYSLGVVLYELLTGRLPYLASTPEEYVELKARRDPRPPRTVREDIPRDLEAICLKCLARQPAERYTTAADLAAALRGRSRAGVWNPWLLAGGVAAVCAVVGLFLALNAGGNPPPNAPVTPNPEVVVQPAPEAVSPTSDEDVISISELKPTGLAATWEVLDNGESVRFASDDLVLFQLGEYRTGDLDFSVDLEQKARWIGGLGVYWGYTPDPEDRDRRRMESFTLYPAVGASFRLRNALMTFSEGKSGLPQENGLASFDFPEPISGRSHRIGFSIRDGVVTKLQWDDLDLSPMLADRTRNFEMPQPHATGGFGLVGYEFGTFTKPTLNGRLLRFAPAAKRRTSP